MIKILSRYNHSPDRTFAFKCSGESMTQQQFKAECDINNIMAKYKKTQMITHLNKHQAQFGDFSNFEEYQVALDKVSEAQRSFDQIPAQLRNKFENDPGKLVAYLADENNHEEAIKFGLMVRKPSLDPLADSMEKALEKNDQKRQKAQSEKSAKEK